MERIHRKAGRANWERGERTEDREKREQRKEGRGEEEDPYSFIHCLSKGRSCRPSLSRPPPADRSPPNPNHSDCCR